MTWIYLYNLRGLNALFYCVLRHYESLKHARILIWRVITSGTQNPLILIIFARYHNIEGSSVMYYEYNGIPCIFWHCRISLEGYMPINIQDLMSPYCLKPTHPVSSSKSYVLHRSKFKVMVTNILPLGIILFIRSDTLILRLNPCLNSGELVPSALNQHFWRPPKMEQDPRSCHLVNVIDQIVCIISRAYEDGLKLIHCIMI